MLIEYSKDEPTEPSAPLPLGVQVGQLLMIAFRCRQPVLLEGDTGIGKTAIIMDATQRLKVGYRMLDLSLLDPPDLIGLPVIHNQRTHYAVPDILPQNGQGILVLEELNRADRALLQPILQLLSARRLNQYQLPSGWHIVATANPEHSDYQVNALDPALRARFLTFKVRADRRQWLNWAKHHQIHPAIIDLASSHAHIFSQTTPRSWAYASKLLCHLQPDEISDGDLLQNLLTGLLPPLWSQALVRRIVSQSEQNVFASTRWLTRYGQDQLLKQRLKDIMQMDRNDQLQQLVDDIRQHLLDDQSLNASFNLDAFEYLLLDLPEQHREPLQEAFASHQNAQCFLAVNAAQLLDRYDPSVCSQVLNWLTEAGLRHRGWAVCLGVEQRLIELDQAANNTLTRLRKDRLVQAAIESLLSVLHAPYAQRLRAALHKYQFQTVPA